MENKRYPKIHIGSKNELAKRLSNTKFPREESLSLINDVKRNFDKYWRDNMARSEPLKEKYVRSAKGTQLGRLLNNINEKVLAPHDGMMPNFIFGGMKGMDHSMAAGHLLGKKRYRTLLKLDIKRFFEQVSRQKVINFLQKSNCSEKAARLIADFCCVPVGPKGSMAQEMTIARGFATSSRLAAWCNLDIFIKLDRIIKKRLKGKDPRVAIYVDDIGIMASRVTEEEMEALKREIVVLFKKEGLVLHKMDITPHNEKPVHLGLELRRNKLLIGPKTKSKIERLQNKSKKNLSPEERVFNKQRLGSLMRYKNYTER